MANKPNPGAAASAQPAAPQAEPSNDDLRNILSAGAPVADDDADPVLDQDDPEPAADADADPDFDGPAAKAPAADAADADADPDADQAPAADAAKPDADPDDALDDEIAEARAEFTPAQQKAFDRALRKKSARVIQLRTELEAAAQRASAAEAALEEARTAAPAATQAPSAEDPLADVESETSLDAKLAESRRLRRWCLAHRDGGMVGEGDKAIEVSAEKAAALLAEAEEIIEEHAPKRREFLKNRAQFDQAAQAAYPFLKNAASPGARVVEATLKNYPGLKRIFPGARLAVADMLMGAHYRQQQAQKAAKPAAAGTKAPVAPSSPAGASRPPRVNGAVKASGEAQRALATTGDDPDNAALKSIIARR
jgi:hypothetical protein